MIRINSDGNQQAITMANMKLDDVKNHALVVHQQADDYSTSPASDSGTPIACGVVR
ncbi:MAG TPA: superoxide dismutase family protein [Rheinheimera sp.]|nr:superoxide dismutase family protein [Rheinheimera sp.]